MPLPKIDAPIFTTKQPSTGDKIQYRPFLVGEEKKLLVAIESGEKDDVINAVKSVIQDCVLVPLKIDKLPKFDLEYLFLKIRSKSVGEVIDFRFKHIDGLNSKGKECNHVQDLSVNIEEMEVNFDENHTRKIQLTDTIGVVMRYPTLSDSIKEVNTKTEQAYDTIVGCVEAVWDGDEVYDSFTFEEADEFLNSLSKDQLGKITEFFNTMPKLKHVIEYQCEGCGSTERVVLGGLEGLFT